LHSVGKQPFRIGSNILRESLFLNTQNLALFTLKLNTTHARPHCLNNLHKNDNKIWRKSNVKNGAAQKITQITVPIQTFIKAVRQRTIVDLSVVSIMTNIRYKTDKSMMSSGSAQQQQLKTKGFL